MLDLNDVLLQDIDLTNVIKVSQRMDYCETQKYGFF